MTVIGYVLNNDGTYSHKYYFEGTAKKMATFIIQFQKNDTVITDGADEILCSSMYGFLDKVNENIREELLEVILPLQAGGKLEKINFIESEPYVMKEI